jgi:hypothetical protein
MKTKDTVVSALGSAKPSNGKKRRRWGHWRYDPKLLTLTYLPYDYEVDLETCTNSAAVLDWVAQVAGKNWGTKAVGSFVLALNTLLELQVNVCGSARDREFNPSQWLRGGNAS